MRWLTDPARPWAGVSPLQHASDTGTLAAWIDKRLGEEASGPVGAFLPVARYEPAPDADLADADPDTDPLAQLRMDIGAARRAKRCLVESANGVGGFSGVGPTQRFSGRADSARILRAIWSSCGSRSHATLGRRAGSRAGYSTPRHPGQCHARIAGGSLCRHRLTGWRRRIEAQLLDQLGVEVAIDSAPLGGRDLLARSTAFRRFTEGGLSIDDARSAAGI